MKNDYFNSFERGDIEMTDDIELDAEHSCLYITLDVWFDVDKKFGINVNADDSTWVNMFANYQPFTDELRIFYDIDTDSNIYEREYIPTDEEREMFVNAIQQECIQENGMNCREFYIREYMEYHADKIDLVCEQTGEGYQVRNLKDDFILYAEGNDGLLKDYVGKQIEMANYADSGCYSIECMDTHEVLYSTDSETLEPIEGQEQSM